jgi:hypothetical protein
VLLVLFVDGSVDYHAELGQRLTAMLEEHDWRSRASGSLADAVQHEIYQLRHRLWALDLLGGPRSLASTLKLTDTGEAATLAALRARALPPRHRIGLG